MQWNVYIENINHKSIQVYDIFQGGYLEKEIKSRTKGMDKEEFEKALKSYLQYRFWSKCEWEIILSDWPPSETFNKKKIDVYQQLQMNWPIFVDYVWNNLKKA